MRADFLWLFIESIEEMPLLVIELIRGVKAGSEAGSSKKEETTRKLNQNCELGVI